MRMLLAILIMLMINVGLFFVQTSIDYIAASEGLTAQTKLLNAQNSVLYTYSAGNGSYAVPILNGSELPTSSQAVGTGVTTFITDIGNSILGWIQDSPIYKFITAVPAFLYAIGLPQEFAWALGAMWMFLGITLVVVFIRGGGG